MNTRFLKISAWNTVDGTIMELNVVLCRFFIIYHIELVSYYLLYHFRYINKVQKISGMSYLNIGANRCFSIGAYSCH